MRAVCAVLEIGEKNWPHNLTFKAKAKLKFWPMIDFKMIGDYRAKHDRVNIWPTMDFFNTKKQNRNNKFIFEPHV
jgi:hypothetical protein